MHSNIKIDLDELYFQVLALVAGVLLEKQVVVVCPNLVS